MMTSSATITEKADMTYDDAQGIRWSVRCAKRLSLFNRPIHISLQRSTLTTMKRDVTFPQLISKQLIVRLCAIATSEGSSESTTARASPPANWSTSLIADYLKYTCWDYVKGRHIWHTNTKTLHTSDRPRSSAVDHLDDHLPIWVVKQHPYILRTIVPIQPRKNVPHRADHAASPREHELDHKTQEQIRPELLQYLDHQLGIGDLSSVWNVWKKVIQYYRCVLSCVVAWHRALTIPSFGYPLQ